MEKRNFEIDRLRAVAILFVLAHHIPAWMYPWSLDVDPFYTTGWTGVHLFFVISGYVIAKSLVPQIHLLGESNPGSITQFISILKAFYTRRFFRIVPLAVFWLIPMVVGSLFLEQNLFGTWSTMRSELVGLATMTYNYVFVNQAHAWKCHWFWSLCVEEHFYFILPFFLYFVPSTKGRVRALGVGILTIAFVFRPLWEKSGELYVRAASHLNFDCLMAGCLIYFLSVQPWFHSLITKAISRKKWVLSVLNFVLLYSLLTLPVALQRNLLPTMTATLAISSLLVFLAAFEQNFILPVPQKWRLLNWFGSRSYVLYLCHAPVFRYSQTLWSHFSLLFGFDLTPQNLFVSLGYTVSTLILLIVCAELSHQFIEKPMIRRGKELSSQFLHKPTDAISTWKQPAQKAL